MKIEIYEKVIALHNEKMSIIDFRIRNGIEDLTDNKIEEMDMLSLCGFNFAYRDSHKERICKVMRECLKELLHDNRLEEIDKEIEEL